MYDYYLGGAHNFGVDRALAEQALAVMPTVGAVHEVAHAVDAAAEVVYIDNEPVAVSHAELLLAHVAHARVVTADLTDPDQVLGHPMVRAALDWSQPVAVLALAVLHFVADPAAAAAVLNRYRTAMGPSGWLVFSHVTADHNPGEARWATAVYQRSASPVYARSHHELHEMLAGYELLEPGLVDATEWRPGSPAPRAGEHAGFYAAVARPAPAGPVAETRR